MKKQVNIRASDQTRAQLDKLTEWWGTSRTETIALLVDRAFQQEKDKHIKSFKVE